MGINEKITFYYTGSQAVVNAGQNLQYYEEFQKIGEDLAKLNLNRGGKYTYGFEFEQMHAASKNLQNMKKGNGEIIRVLDDNSKADFVTIMADGKETFQQAKVGYHGSNKYKITKKKYEDQTIVVDKGNTEQIAHLNKEGLKNEMSNISEEAAKRMDSIMQTEGKIRGKLNLDDTKAPITAELYKAGNQLAAASQAGIHAAKSTAALAAGMSFGKNMYAYIEGNKDLREMLFDTAADTAKAALGGFAGGSVSYLAAGMVSKTVVGQAITGVIVKAASGTVLVTAGSITAALSAAAGPAFLMGMAIGAGYAMCQSAKIRAEIYHKKMVGANRALSQALISMRMAYNSLEQEIKDFFDFWDASIDVGFEKILKAVSDNDFKGFSEGLDSILQVFDSQVIFKTEKEFDDFFFDDSVVLNL